MTEFDDEKVISALRSAGTDGPAFVMTPLAETTRRGQAARRRRTVLAGVGVTTLAALTVTAAVAVPPLLDGRDAVPPLAATDPPDEPTQEPTDEPTGGSAGDEPPTTAAEMVAANKAAVFEALPDGFVRLSDENRADAAGLAGFAVAESAPATDGLPDGMSAGIDLLVFASDEAEQSMGGDMWCTGFSEKDTVTTDCADLEVEGETVQVQQSSQPGSGERRAWESTRTTYENPNGDVVALDIKAWEDEVTAAPRAEAARAWVDTMHEQIVSIVLDPSFRPTEWNERRDAEAQALAADLGERWNVLEGPPASSVYPTEELADTLPDGASAGVTRDVLRDTDLSELCSARTEDGIQREACEPVPGSDVMVGYGEMVDPEHRGEDSFDTRLADVVVYHEHDGGSITRVRVVVTGMGVSDSDPDPASLRSWLEAQVPDLVRAATSVSWSP